MNRLIKTFICILMLSIANAQNLDSLKLSKDDDFCRIKKGKNFDNANQGIDNQIEANKLSNSIDKNYPIITIPVVFHVLWKTQEQNLDRSRLKSQIDVLNKAFRMANKNEILKRAPKIFSPLAGDMKIEFKIDTVIRKQTDVDEFFMQEESAKYDSTGGSNVIDPLHKLNIWVCQLEDGLYGYAQFPGEDPITDGVVLTTNVVGINKSCDTCSWAYVAKGKVGVHEVGHWLGLLHIWGDDCWFGGGKECFGSDRVKDTPNQGCPTRGCPNDKDMIVSCGMRTMTMNYMNYVGNDCMYMFTKGQVERTRSAIKLYRPELLKKK